MNKIFFHLAMPLLLFQLAMSGCAPAGPEVKFDQPTKIIHDADLDYHFLNNIDRITPPFPPGSRYQIGDIPTVKGRYIIYKYLIEYPGRSAESGAARFHDLLVIKTDSTGKILDAYHYTLEWADAPSLDLYQMKNKGIYLKPDLKLKDLGLINTITGRQLGETESPVKREDLVPEQRIVSPLPSKLKTGDIFKQEEKELNKKADDIIQQAKSYKEAKEKLIELQKQADFSWKGHGPQIKFLPRKK